MKRTPRLLSPFMLLQEFLRHDAWKLLVGCMLLNRTDHIQVHGLVNELFERWPNPNAMRMADPIELAEFLRPLGLQNRRAKALIRMSEEYLEDDWDHPEDLYGVGRYAADSFVLFCRGYLIEDVADKELKNYVAWAKSLGSDDDVQREEAAAGNGHGRDGQGLRESEGTTAEARRKSKEAECP